jgi:hypothetical protein
LESSPRPSFRVLALDEIDAIPIPGALNWRPVRGALGVRAFGVASFHAVAAGDALIEPHRETTDGLGHEELYFVVRGRARFELDGAAFDAPAGTLVHVQPEVHRHGVAVEADTEVLAFGGFPVFRPSGSEYIWRVRAALPDVPAAQAIVDDGAADSPGVPSLPSSPETFMTEKSLSLRARTESCGDVGERAERSQRPDRGASRRRAQRSGRCAAVAGGGPGP